MKCRFCSTELANEFIDLVSSPPSNSFLTSAQLNEPEVFYPLKVQVCHKCFLVQIDEYKKSDAIFNNEYVYFSSYSTSWLKHSATYVEMMVKRFNLTKGATAFEIASNDGYLLQYFLEKDINVLGIEPTANTAAVAVSKGIETVVDFFGIRLATQLAEEGRKADVLLGNNVLAHVPDINDFVGGMAVVLKQNGVITMEFPHLLQLIEQNQFDTIYHEHFSYLSLVAVNRIFSSHGLRIFDVEEIPTHGGSLRIFACHSSDNTKPIMETVQSLLEKEIVAGLNKIDKYTGFQQKAVLVKHNFLSFLLDAQLRGKKVAAYGAAAKGNTLLNYCGVKQDLLSFVVDANPAKQGKFLPGSHLPVLSEDTLKAAKPDYVVIFPWNIKEEVMQQLEYIRSWDGKFVIAIPSLQIL